MKKFLVIALGSVSVSIATAQPAVKIAEYLFDSIPSTTLGTNKAAYTNFLVLASASPMYASGAGISNTTYFNGPTGGALNRAKASTNWPPAFTASKHFGFGMTPVAPMSFVIDSISFWARRSPVGPTDIQLRTSANGFSSAVWTGTNGAGDVWKRHSITGGFPLPTNAPLDVRLYTYGTMNLGTTWRIDTVRVYGHLDGVFNLPIELTSFTGYAVEQGVQLDWATASETENDYFTILRSTDTEDWQEVARVDGAGESQAEIRYRLLDAHPEIGTNYYRLRQTDYDGEFEDSQVLAVLWQPFDPSSAQVFDAQGKFVRDWNGDVFGLAPGVYVLRDKHSNTKKVLAPP